MNRKSILLGLSAIGALVLAGNANAQIVGGAGGTLGGGLGGVTGQAGAAGQITAPTPSIPTDRATGAARGAAEATTAAARRAKAKAAATTTQTVDKAQDAAATGADASATAATSGQAAIPVGTVVRNSAGLQLGTVMASDAATTASGRVAIKTSTGFITVPASGLTMQGDVAISAEASPDVASPAPQ